MQMTTEYLKWGGDVDVRVPPAHRTVDAMEIIKGQGGSFAPPTS